MIVGILKEIKQQESRVSMTPVGVEEMKKNGHTVLVEKAAGEGSGFSDDAYKAAGAEIVATAKEIYDRSEMVMHVKEPMPAEYDMIREDQLVFTYFHFAAEKELTDAFIKSKAVGVAYETVIGPQGGRPLLNPMSEVAGRMSAEVAANLLLKTAGGPGKIMGGVTGVAPATALVVGGGMVGTNAAQILCGLGAQVYITDVNLDRLRYLDEVMPKNCTMLMSSSATLRELVQKADVIIGSVLIPGAKAPKLVTRDMLKLMKPGTVMVDVAIDQGGCFESSHPTTHENPTFVEEGITHYCVTNMPGAAAMTSTMALTNATLPYAIKLANKGWKQACKDDAGLKQGLNIAQGKVTFKGVSDAFGLPYTPADDML